MKGEQITTTKDGVKSYDNELYDDYLILDQMLFYAKSDGHPN
jgi:hypothetical protein